MLFSNLKLLIFFCLFIVFNLQAQNCNNYIKGRVFDDGTSLPLSFVNILIQESLIGTTSDKDGFFILDNLCQGEIHLIISHIGCEPKKILIDLKKDTTLSIQLPHTVLGTIVVEGEQTNNSDFQSNSTLNRTTIENNSNKTLGGLIENESGVNLMKNGSGISKPIVHGLYGNRLKIINNDIIQSGQVWGNGHAPEIDPLSVDKITIIKGTSAIEYGAGNLGSVVLLEQKKIEKEPHLHGQINYVYESNGRGNNVNLRLEKYSGFFAWRINGTLKKYGDKKSSTYFLNNTGYQEANFSLTLQKSWKEKLFLDIYASTFNTRLGILRGSQVGNITALNNALNAEIPDKTDSLFSYNIDAPKQEINHHLAKFKLKYFFNENNSIIFLVAGQLNNRKEFDIRKGGRSVIPSVDLLQYTYNSELKYTHSFKNSWKFKVGNQNIVINNTNDPNTGILPLIPDYNNWKNGLFTTLSRKKKKTNFKIGFRYDAELQKVAEISNDLPRRIIRYENNFHNISGLSSIKFSMTSKQSLTINSGYSERNPGINELYSFGLHQGVSGLEEGTLNLKKEKALKNTLEYIWYPSSNFSINTLIYHQSFNGFINLIPKQKENANGELVNEIRTTIRGAFPVFKYQQTNANIYGFDISSQFSTGNSILGLIKYSFLRGQDVKNKIPLIYMPSNSIFGSLKYQLKKSKKLNKGKFKNTEIEINNRFVFEQKNILIGQDFVSPPSSYNLFGFKLSTNLILPHYKIRFFTKFNNLFNIKYRDYLNRQRYFANDLGLSVIIGLNFKF